VDTVQSYRLGFCIVITIHTILFIKTIVELAPEILSCIVKKVFGEGICRATGNWSCVGKIGVRNRFHYSDHWFVQACKVFLMKKPYVAIPDRVFINFSVLRISMLYVGQLVKFS
jgi:hypothetical protein